MSLQGPSAVINSDLSAKAATKIPIRKLEAEISDEAVPETLPAAVLLFVKQPSIIGTLLGIVGLTAYRLSSPWTVADPFGKTL